MENIRRLKEAYDKVLGELGYTISIGDDFDSIRVFHNKIGLKSHTTERDTAWFTTFYEGDRAVVFITREGELKIILEDGTIILVYYDNHNTKEVNFTIMGNIHNSFNKNINVAISDSNDSYSVNASVYFDSSIRANPSHMSIKDGQVSFHFYNGSFTNEISIKEEEYLEVLEYYINQEIGSELPHAWNIIYPAIVLCIRKMIKDLNIGRIREKKRELEEYYSCRMDELNNELEKWYEYEMELQEKLSNSREK